MKRERDTYEEGKKDVEGERCRRREIQGERDIVGERAIEENRDVGEKVVEGERDKGLRDIEGERYRGKERCRRRERYMKG